MDTSYGQVPERAIDLANRLAEMEIARYGDFAGSDQYCLAWDDRAEVAAIVDELARYGSIRRQDRIETWIDGVSPYSDIVEISFDVPAKDLAQAVAAELLERDADGRLTQALDWIDAAEDDGLPPIGHVAVIADATHRRLADGPFASDLPTCSREAETLGVLLLGNAGTLPAQAPWQGLTRLAQAGLKHPDLIAGVRILERPIAISRPAAHGPMPETGHSPLT